MINMFEQWEKYYDTNYRGYAYSMETGDFIKKGFFELSPDDVDKMIDSLEYDHLLEYMRLI